MTKFCYICIVGCVGIQWHAFYLVSFGEEQTLHSVLRVFPEVLLNYVIQCQGLMRWCFLGPVVPGIPGLHPALFRTMWYQESDWGQLYEKHVLYPFYPSEKKSFIKFIINSFCGKNVKCFIVELWKFCLWGQLDLDSIKFFMLVFLLMLGNIWSHMWCFQDRRDRRRKLSTYMINTSVYQILFSDEVTHTIHMLFL